MVRHLSIILIVLAFGSSAYAKKGKWLYGGLGFLNQAVFKNAASAAGGAGFIGQIHPALALTFDLGFLLPSVAYTPLGASDDGDSAKVRVLSVNIPWVFYGRSKERFSLRGGAGIWFQIISGSGGLIQLSNGSSTSTFANPGRSVTTRSAYFSLGFGTKFSKVFRFDLDAQITGPLTRRRTVNLLALVSMGFL